MKHDVWFKKSDILNNVLNNRENNEKVFWCNMKSKFVRSIWHILHDRRREFDAICFEWLNVKCKNDVIHKRDRL